MITIGGGNVAEIYDNSPIAKTVERMAARGRDGNRPQYEFYTAQVMDAVARLDSLTSSFRNFKSRYDDLVSHLKFIDESIDARLRLRNHVAPSAKPNTKKICKELKFLCENMAGKSLQKYLVQHHIDGMERLRKELPIAIMGSCNPHKLALDCAGKFFTQGINAYKKNRDLQQTRLVAVLVLESLLLAIANRSVAVDDDDRQEAEKWAVLWKNRLDSEGGIRRACRMDACGLLFLVCGFGIPKSFSDDDIWELVITVLKKKCDTLRCSSVLSEKITGILEKMMRKEMVIEALDVVRAFGMEKKFPYETILNAYLKECNRIFNRRRNEAQTDTALQKRAFSKHLDALHSALNFLKDRNFSSLMAAVEETISKLENQIRDSVQIKTENSGKRKYIEIEGARMSELPRKKDSPTMAAEECPKAGVKQVEKITPRGKQYENRSHGGGSPRNDALTIDVRGESQFSCLGPLTTRHSSGLPTLTASFNRYARSPASAADEVSPEDLYGFVDKVLKLEFGHC